MPPRKKLYSPLDLAMLELLQRAVADSGHTVRSLVAATGLGQNRVGIILRGETPPPSVGEIGAIAVACGVKVSHLIAEAEARASGEEGPVVVLPEDDFDVADIEAASAAMRRTATAHALGTLTPLAARDADDDAETEAQQIDP